MPCRKTKIGEETVAIICSRERIKRCAYCSDEMVFLCDFPVRKLKNGKWKTCDKHLCGKHTLKGKSKEVDFCRDHYEKAKAAYNRRTSGVGK
jgi:hypothetical protein